MHIVKEVDQNGKTYETLKLTTDESKALDKCHEVLRKRFESRGEPYNRVNKERCEWWLLGFLRFEGVEQMMNVAKNAPFR